VLQRAQLSAAAYRGLQKDDTDAPNQPRVHSGAAIGGERWSDNHHLPDSVEPMNGNMGELIGDVQGARAIRDGKAVLKPSEVPMSAVSVAIVVGARESRVQGEAAIRSLEMTKRQG
jgi:hypothetical protein